MSLERTNAHVYDGLVVNHSSQVLDEALAAVASGARSIFLHAESSTLYIKRRQYIPKINSRLFLIALQA